GDQTEIEDLFYKFNIEPKHWENIISHIVCHGCGTNITLGCDVAVKTKYDIKFEDFIKNCRKSFLKKVESFNDFLQDTPLLGYKHPIGKRIHK
ncbi:hypothetical protein M8994_21570, partial [Brucella sp. 21LCYQ03]|nr:hypothetical protein [Brucella sp. 21LCYQ03]